MKIKITEVEANAQELQQSKPLADCFYNLLGRVLRSVEPSGDGGEEPNEEPSGDETEEPKSAVYRIPNPFIEYAPAKECMNHEAYGYGLCCKCEACGRRFVDGVMVDDGGTHEATDEETEEAAE